MSSRVVHMLPGCVRTIERALRLPRARQIPWRERRERRRRARGRLSDILIFEAAAVLAGGGAPVARENLIAALKLAPLRSARPWTFQLLWRSLERPGRRAEIQ
jgi:hypothetical protein